MPITLMYHDVIRQHDDDSGFAGAGAARYKLSRDEFDRHLAALTDVVSEAPGVLADLVAGKVPGWFLTFDDGGVSAITEIADALEQRGWRGWFLITTNRINTPGFLSAGQIRELDARGHVIGAHSCSHPARFSHCSSEQQFAEWYDSRMLLRDILGHDVLSASVPGGFYSRTVAEQAAKAGLKYLFNSEPTTMESTVDGCRVLGRYTVNRGMTAAHAAAILSSSWPRYRQLILWNAKKLAKQTGGAGYLKVRELLLRKAYATGS